MEVVKGAWAAGPAGALIGVVIWLTDKPFVKAEVLLKTVQPGDLIEFDKGHYKHWAMYSNRTGFVFNVPAESKEVTITMEKLTDVARDDGVRVNNQERMARKMGYKPRPRSEALEAAKSDVRKTFKYDFINCNCECYCTKWFYGEGFCTQVSEAAINVWITSAHAQLFGIFGAAIGAAFGGPVSAGVGYTVGAGVVGGIMSGVIEMFGITIYTTNRWAERLIQWIYK